MKYIPGYTNISDVLSRLVEEPAVAFDDQAEHYLFAVEGGRLSAITLDEIRKETTRDGTMLAVTKALKTHNWPSELLRYQAVERELGVVSGIVVRDDRIVLPEKLRPRALQIAHRGHPGIVAMRRSLRENLWWPCMDREVMEYVEECAGCTAVRSQNPPEPMIRKEMPQRAWQDVAIDFFSAKECGTFLVIVDYFSRFAKVIEMKTGTNAAKTIDALDQVFHDHTYPETIRCDNGPPFASEDFAEYCHSKNMRLVRTIPYWPQMNGLVEKLNQGILRSLRIAVVTKEDWRRALRDFTYMYNTTPHSVTGKAPLELMTGRPIKDLLPSLRTDPTWNREEGVREEDAVKKLKGKLYADRRRHAKPSEIKVGDAVLLRNYETGKLEPKFRLEKFVVIRKTGSDTVVKNDEGLMYRRSVTDLRKYPSGDDSDEDSAQEEVEGETETSKRKAKTTEASSDGIPAKRPARNKKVPERYLD